jgi:hypothetical protein
VDTVGIRNRRLRIIGYDGHRCGVRQGEARDVRWMKGEVGAFSRRFHRTSLGLSTGFTPTAQVENCTRTVREPSGFWSRKRARARALLPPTCPCPCPCPSHVLRPRSDFRGAHEADRRMTDGAEETGTKNVARSGARSRARGERVRGEWRPKRADRRMTDGAEETGTKNVARSGARSRARGERVRARVRGEWRPKRYVAPTKVAARRSMRSRRARS